ncbi:outer membrane protein assembly factor BamB [Polymorphobacter multimanifer]|uniref:outer membrane protein assembly factor BamB family protein n=1 Tax=Polymorphobacter multimanifer TaxID=1070431 RepID=UPI00166658DD|nr:PQQ-like beta-propeller repeat protein [Polymorphobacter multimanifer]GGI77637.1 outer membrane protein assembly factor BamB [Polymorphobacter multimanifer]
MQTRRAALALITVLALGVSGCGVFKGGKKKITTVGERIPVLTYESKAEAEAELQGVTVVLPLESPNADWGQPGGTPSKLNGHLTWSGELQQVWSASIGSGSTKTRRLNASPVIHDGRVFTIDTMGRVAAFDARTGAPAWSAQIELEGQAQNIAFGGGVSADNGRVFATTGFGIVVAYDAQQGVELWRRTLPAPLRGAPTVEGNRVFVLSQDNQLFALSAETGEQSWSVTGTVEVAGLLGTGAPAISQETVVVGFSSGELTALRAENGRTVWSDALARTGRATAMSALSDIDASPVIDRGRVFAIGHGGRMAALEMATGQRVWERNFAGISTPWLAGEFIYAVTLEGELLCLTRSEGKVRWVTELERWKNMKKKTGPIVWSGPVLGSEKLLMVSSEKAIVTVDPYEGKVLARGKLSAAAYLPPVLAGGLAYVLTDDGKLTAWR